jgi:hypothetical protein
MFIHVGGLNHQFWLLNHHSTTPFQQSLAEGLACFLGPRAQPRSGGTKKNTSLWNMPKRRVGGCWWFMVALLVKLVGEVDWFMGNIMIGGCWWSTEHLCTQWLAQPWRFPHFIHGLSDYKIHQLAILGQLHNSRTNHPPTPGFLKLLI